MAEARFCNQNFISLKRLNYLQDFLFEKIIRYLEKSSVHLKLYSIPLYYEQH